MLILITFLILLAAVYGKQPSCQMSPEVLITVGAYLSAITIALTVLLSTASLLKPVPTNLAWAIIAAALALSNYKYLRIAARRIRKFSAPISMQFSWSALLVGTFALGTLLSGLLYPIRNWDSLWHIMPRVTFWIQQGNCAPFLTPVGQQLTTYPLSAWFITHIKLTTGGSDVFVDIIQWSAYLCAIYFVSQIARLMGASVRGRRWVTILAATLPMAILQATTTQYDLLVGAFALATVYLIMSLILNPIKNVNQHDLFSKTITLALLISAGINAKITYVFMVAPFLIWLSIVALKELDYKTITKHACAALGIVMIFALPWFGLNFITHGGDMLGIHLKGNSHILIKDRSLEGIMTNVIRGATTPLGTPIPKINTIMEHSIEKSASIVGLNLDGLIDRESADLPYKLSAQITNNDLAPYPITLIALALAIVLLTTHKFPSRNILILYASCALFSYLALSALISWQPYIVRTLIGPSLIGLPFIGALEPHLKRLGSAAFRVLVTTSCLLGLVVLLWNSSAPLVPQTYRPLNPSESLGYWNATRQHLQFAYSLPDVEPLAERLIIDIGLSNKTVAVGGSQAISFPLYLLMRPLKNTLFSYRENLNQATEDYFIEIISPSEFDTANHTVPSGYTLFGEQHYQSGEKYVIAVYKKTTN